MLAGRACGTLDEFLICLPIVGQLYESYIRRDTCQQQDHRHIYASLVNTIIGSKVKEFCQVGGLDDPPFENISNPVRCSRRRSWRSIWGGGGAVKVVAYSGGFATI